MPSWKTVYGEHLTGADMVGKTVVATVKAAEEETIGDKKKVVIYFHELEKDLVLNVTNCEKMQEITGTEDYLEWPGTKIELFSEKVKFGRETVDAVRIRKPTPQQQPQPVNTGAPSSGASPAPLSVDDTSESMLEKAFKKSAGVRLKKIDMDGQTELGGGE
jgi:hypothetical protein